VKADKAALAAWVLEGKRARDFESLGLMHTNRLHSILNKWCDAGWWDFGVSLRTGWLTNKGKQELRRRLQESPQ